MSVIEPEQDFDEEDDDPELYELSLRDKRLVDVMARLCGRMAAVPGITHKDLVALGFAVYGLRRMPRPTPGLALEISISSPLAGNDQFKIMRTWSLAFESDPAVVISSGGWVEMDESGGDSFTRFEWRASLNWPAEFSNYTHSLDFLDSVHWPRNVAPPGSWLDELNGIDDPTGHTLEVELYKYPSNIEDDVNPEPTPAAFEELFGEDDDF